MSSLLLSNLSRAVSTEFLSGILLADVDAGQCGHSQSEIAQCNVFVVQLAVFVTELLKPPSRTIRYVLNERGLSGGNMTIYNQMYRQMIDLMSTPISLPGFDDDMAYFHAQPAYSIAYGIFGNTNVANAKRTELSSLNFLFAPFTPTVWLLIGITLAYVFVTENIFMRKLTISYNGLGMRASLLALSSVAMIGVFYNTELKTLAVLPGDLFDLVESVRNGERVIIVESNNSVRWELLTKPTKYRPESLQALYEAIHERGRDKAFLCEPNRRNLCHLLETSSIHVYFGFEEKLVGICQLNGLVKYFTVAYPSFMHIGVATTSPAAKYTNTLLHAYHNYREITLTRMIGSAGFERLRRRLKRPH